MRIAPLLFFLVLSPWASAAPFGAKTVPVIVSTLEQKPFRETIEALGTLRSSEAVTLSATVTETVRAIHFEDGQRVRQNDVLVEMTSNEEHALLEEAQSTLDEAKRQYERVRSLIKSGLATESVLDERQQAYESAQAQWLATQSRLEDRLIVAPFDGVVGLRSISMGTLVRPGDAITTLDDDRIMKLDFSIPAVFVNDVKPGLTIQATSSAFGEQVYSGTVTSVDSRIDPATRSVVVRAQIPNADYALKAGLLMTVKLTKNERLALLLPEEALIQEGYNTYVYVVQDGDPLTVTRKQITIGTRQRGEVEVTQGLAEGDRVVAHGILHLREGGQVTIAGELKDGTTVSEIIAQKPAETRQ